MVGGNSCTGWSSEALQQWCCMPASGYMGGLCEASVWAQAGQPKLARKRLACSRAAASRGGMPFSNVSNTCWRYWAAALQ